MTTELLIGASAVALIAAMAAIVIVTVVRARAAADERVAQAIRNLAAGMQDTMRDLTAAFERARAVAEPQEPAQELAASLDLEDVTKRTLQAAQAISGVDAAVLELDDVDGERTRAALGLEPDEARRVAVAAPPNESLRALEVVYRYGDEAAAAGEPVRSAIVLPVRAATGALGSLGAYSRSTPADAAGAVARLERIAHRAGPAVENAQVFARARRMADTDALTGFNNHRFFHETLGREVARARRYERRIALVVFDLDDFKAINDRIGHLAGDAVLAEVAERVRTVMRSTDIAGRVGGDEFAVMLPEAGRADAELLAERIMRIVASRPIANAGTLYVSAGIAELRSDDTAREMFERADNALYAAKEAGKAQVRPANDA